MKNDIFTTDDYLRAIERELGKRATTYPKILKKLDENEVEQRMKEMEAQIVYLKAVKFLIEFELHALGDLETCLSELMRELKMRKSYYPRLIYFKRLDEQTAAYEIAVWESLTRWFAKQYLGLDELPTKRRKKL